MKRCLRSTRQVFRHFVKAPFKGRVAYEWQVFNLVLQWRLPFENPKYLFECDPSPVPVFLTRHVGRLHVWTDTCWTWR